jgi:hypothetical protein
MDTIPMMVKGADVPSEAALFTTSGFPTDGRYFDITGTNDITSILASGAVDGAGAAITGTVIGLHFNSVLTISDDGTNLVLPGGIDYTVEAGEEVVFVEYAAGDWRMIASSKSLKENAIALLSATTVSFAADADTTLYTVPTGKRCILSHAIVVAGADAGATTTISIGQNTAETDFVPANTLSNLDAQFDAVIIKPIPNTTPLKNKSYAATTVIEAQVAANSGGATNTVYLFGMLY